MRLSMALYQQAPSLSAPLGAFAVLALCVAGAGAQQYTSRHAPGDEGTRNIRILSHVPLPGVEFSTSGLEVEQELSRPYAYVSHTHRDPGFYVITLKDPTKASVLYRWVIQEPELHRTGFAGGMENKYFKLRGRYYDVQSLQFLPGGPDVDLGAVVFDVTGLPDTNKVREVGRIRAPDSPGGFHTIFAYKHSDGRALLFTTSDGPPPHAKIFDMEKFLSGDPQRGLTGRVPVPPNPNNPNYGYHDVYVGYDPTTHQDKFYGAGSGGGLVYDVTRPEDPKLLTSVTGVAGVSDAHTFVPTSDGRYVLQEALPTYQHSVVRVFDLKPGLEGQVKTISRPIGAWTYDWRAAAHNFELRWPYAFVSAQDGGLQVVNIMDPTNPYTVGYYDTKQGPPLHGESVGGDIGNGGGIYDGAWGVDVRNADGLIVVSDFRTGFWAFRMDGFNGWNGHQWGMPNVSSAQDWDNGPEGAQKGQKVSLR